MCCVATLMAFACLLASVHQVSAEEPDRGQSPETALAGPALDAVKDVELGAVYGKGAQWPVLRPEDQLSVILWDEGKRKVRINGAGTDVLSFSHSALQRNGTEGLH